MSMSGPPPGNSPGASGQAADPAPRACYRHPDRPTYVSCVRCERPICAECMRPASVGFQCPDDVADGRRSQRPLRNVFGAPQLGGRPYVTWTLLGLNILAFILQGFPISSGTAANKFTLDYVTANSAIAFGHQYYRLLTGTFLHIAIWHIAVNMLVLLLIGPALEAMLGKLRYTSLYLLSAIGGSVLTYVLKGPAYVSLGASGAIYGLFAAYWVLARRVGADTSAITGTIVLNLIISVTFPGISLLGHVGGLITGGLLGAVFAFSRGRWPIQLAGIGAMAVILVVATALRTASLT
jgi:membrane associated rhomboid family serine protease